MTYKARTEENARWMDVTAFPAWMSSRKTTFQVSQGKDMMIAKRQVMQRKMRQNSLKDEDVKKTSRRRRRRRGSKEKREKANNYLSCSIVYILIWICSSFAFMKLSCHSSWCPLHLLSVTGRHLFVSLSLSLSCNDDTRWWSRQKTIIMSSGKSLHHVEEDHKEF